MARDPQAWAAEQAATGAYWYRKCLSFVSNAITGQNSGIADANTAFAQRPAGTAQVKDGIPPVNAPVWWTGGKNGHVALSTGDGYAWTNDLAGKGRISKEKISDIDRWLGPQYTYQGYTTTQEGAANARSGRYPSGAAGKMTDDQIYATARAAGFTPDQARTMTAIAIAESSSNPRALADTRGRTNLPKGTQPEYSFGLWQINVKANGDLLNGAKPETLYDPLTNAKAAKAIYDRQGFNAWSTYKNKTIFRS